MIDISNINNHQVFLLLYSKSSVVYFLPSCCSWSVVCHNPPDLHGNRLDDVWNSVLPPRVPQDACFQRLCVLRVLGRAVQVGQAALVEPPARLVVQSAAALHGAVVDEAGRLTAVHVHVQGAERRRVLVLLLLVATESITCLSQRKFSPDQIHFKQENKSERKNK